MNGVIAIIPLVCGGTTPLIFGGAIPLVFGGSRKKYTCGLAISDFEVLLYKNCSVLLPKESVIEHLYELQ